MVKKSKNIKTIRAFLIAIIAMLLAGIAGIGVNISLQPSDNGYTSDIEFSEEQIPATIEDDQGELIEDDEIPTVEEVDGGLFEDEITGLSI